MDSRGIILSPMVSEKSVNVMGHNQYTFKVHPHANKIQVLKAVEEIFKVKVVKVRTMNFFGKKKRFRQNVGKQPDYKKAIVTLKEGQKIEVFET